jgi:hypothetical protein
LAVKKEQLAKAAQAKMDPRNPKAIGAEVSQPYGNFLLLTCTRLKMTGFSNSGHYEDNRSWRR